MSDGGGIEDRRRPSNAEVMHEIIRSREDAARAIGSVSREVDELRTQLASLPFVRADVHAGAHETLGVRVAGFEAQLVELKAAIAAESAKRESEVEKEATARVSAVEGVNNRISSVGRTALTGLLFPILVALIVGALTLALRLR